MAGKCHRFIRTRVFRAYAPHRHLFSCRHTVLLICLFLKNVSSMFSHYFAYFFFFTEGILNQRIIMSFSPTLDLVFFWHSTLLRCVAHWNPMKCATQALYFLVNVPKKIAYIVFYWFTSSFIIHLLNRAHLFPCNACTLIKNICPFLDVCVCVRACKRDHLFVYAVVLWLAVFLSLVKNLHLLFV